MSDKCAHGWTSPPECPSCVSNERDDLRQKLDASEKESVNRWSIIKDDCHTEEQVKQIALKHLTKEQVEGDSYGVPNSADLCETLSHKLTAMTQERDSALAACAFSNGLLENIVIYLLSDEHENLPLLQYLKGLLAICHLGKGSKADQQVQGLQVQCGSTEKECVFSESEISKELACEEGKRSREVSTIPNENCSENSIQAAADKGKLSGEDPIRRENWENKEAGPMSGLWDFWGCDSGPSSRLYESLRRGVAMHFLSREEAQEIYHRLNTLDCGKDFARRLKVVEEALETLSRLGNEPMLGNSDGNLIAQGALKTLRGAE